MAGRQDGKSSCVASFAATLRGATMRRRCCPGVALRSSLGYSRPLPQGVNSCTVDSNMAWTRRDFAKLGALGLAARFAPNMNADAAPRKAEVRADGFQSASSKTGYAVI